LAEVEINKVRGKREEILRFVIALSVDDYDIYLTTYDDDA
jgi:hypothetical protein